MNPGIQDIVKSAASFVSDIIHHSHSQHREEDMRFIKLKPDSSVKTHNVSERLPEELLCVEGQIECSTYG